MGNMKAANYIVSGVTLILGIIIVAMASQFKIEFGAGDPGAGFWPAMLGVLLILLAVILFIVTVKNAKELEQETFTISMPANKRVYVVMAFVIAFCVVLYFLGFYIATALFIPIVMYILEVRSPKKIIITTAATVIGVYVVFDTFLKISLPLPFFMK